MTLVIQCDACKRTLSRTAYASPPEKDWVHDYKTGKDCCPECYRKKQDQAFEDFWKKLRDECMTTLEETQTNRTCSTCAYRHLHSDDPPCDTCFSFPNNFAAWTPK